MGGFAFGLSSTYNASGRIRVRLALKYAMERFGFSAYLVSGGTSSTSHPLTQRPGC